MHPPTEGGPGRDETPDATGGPLHEHRSGSVRPGCGVVFVGRDDDGWHGVWYDLGSVRVAGDRDGVLAWARAQPAAERLLVQPGTGVELPLDGPEADDVVG